MPKKQKFRSAEAARIWRELKASEAKMLASHAAPLEKGAKAKGIATPMHRLTSSTLPAIPQRNPQIPSLPDTHLGALRSGRAKETYSGELAAREERAERAIEEKKRRTAPVFNKGNSVYFTDDMLEDMKNGSLLRRN